MEEQIEEIFNSFLKFEQEETDDDTKQNISDYLEQIVQPENNLMEQIISFFIEDLSDPERCKKSLKVIKKLNENFPEQVGDSFFKNVKFPAALVHYIQETSMENLSGDAFILLINLFNDNETPKLLKKEAVLNKICKCMEYIEDDSTLNSLVFILSCLSPILEKDNPNPETSEGNLILREFVKHDQLYREKLIHITNKCQGNFKLDRTCKTLSLLLKKKDTCNDFFNRNDLTVIMDVLLREALTNQSSQARLQVLRLLEIILINESYRVDNYRIEDIEEMVQEHIMYNDDEEEDKKGLEKEYAAIANLNQFFQVERILKSRQ